MINVIGQAQLGLHVGPPPVPWRAGLCTAQDGAALVNWNQRHWTVLQRDPSGGWMHTNSVEGSRATCGRRRGLSIEAVGGLLAEIAADKGGFTLHAITGQPRNGRHFLEPECWRAMARADSQEVMEPEDGLPGPAPASRTEEQLRVVSFNVDGLGEYRDPPAARMKAILEQFLAWDPHVLALQEVTMEMFEEFRRGLQLSLIHI